MEDDDYDTGSDAIDLIGDPTTFFSPSQRSFPIQQQQQQRRSGAHVSRVDEETVTMMRLAAKVSARIHRGEGSTEGSGETRPVPSWLKEMRSETNASIAFMVNMIQNQYAP